MGSPSTNGDKITVADPDSEVLIDHTRPAPGVTDVGNGRPRGDAIDHRCWPRAVGDVAAAQPGQMPPAPPPLLGLRGRGRDLIDQRGAALPDP